MSITPVTGGTYFGSSSVSSVTIPSLSMPAGRVLILIGITRDATDRSLSGVTHPALSNIVTQGNTRAFNATTSRSSEVWIVTADSDGSSGDLVITWSGTVWSQIVRVLDVTAVGDLLTIGWNTLTASAASFTVTASQASAKHGVVFANGRVSQSSAALDVSPWNSDKLEQGAGTGYRAISATAANTTGTQQTLSVSAGNITVAVAAEILFAAGAISGNAALQAGAAAVGAVAGLVVAGGVAMAVGGASAAANARSTVAAQVAMTASAAAASGTTTSPVSATAALQPGPATASSLAGQGIAAWPSSLPNPLVEGWVRGQVPEPLSFAPELGPAIRHRRAVGASERRRQQHLLDAIQRQTLLDFWKSTGYGRDLFTLDDPLGGTLTARFVGGIADERRKDDLWRVGYELELSWS